MLKKFTEHDVPSQRGRTFLVTGANSGIGYEAARALAARGGRVLLGCRSLERAEAAMEKIRQRVPDAELAFVPLDQADLASVQAAAELVSREPRLDVLINNAGIMWPALEYTRDGFESQFGVNHLGSFALTALLLPKLEQQDGSRVVLTSSNAHTMQAKIFFDDIDASKSYVGFTRYSQSKLANLLFMLELDRRLARAGSPTIAVACHPGGSNTDLVRNMPAPVRLLAAPAMTLLLNTSAQGAWPTLAAATSPDAEPGGYYGPDGWGEWKGRAGEAKIHKSARDEEVARRLWDLSVEMTGIDPGLD